MEYLRRLSNLTLQYLPTFLYNTENMSTSSEEPSQFWYKKMKTFYRRADKHSHGYITFEEYIKIADYFEKTGQLSPVKAQHLRRALAHTWQHCWCHGTTCDQVMEEEFISNMAEFVKGDRREIVTLAMPYIYEAIDLNKNGEISVEEYRTFLSGHGIDTTHADAAFAAMDTNNDNVISKEEFLHAAEEFFLSNEEGGVNSHCFWGALID
ncbi:sarcoplasmic calcium-binding protein-like [Lingula anatina]|uniref:Sarcoplasmic calcium-binding protein-like n=1 Tax=Lingula anatina TaxID=7574 RepID=A0A1S3IQK9_LINAN|nr:sarcoplasmic calcium-binding protein-like [Lingula anatina]XP_013400506.2 sarcoplasmic calcium-binding protein-like [Lingula anatina]XP_023930004.1 sarcoplasmic calcium-binding protein-like [Lingula anatina]XP_023930005.1 sarcoplasmic calcium-binding protein-like [Lingula anatina]XP_023930006.1 sarcoplasmic calcium-binding protein-like [Lingula anatina]|eukprot:XP_013400505.2 sarcoplasmic calcium-binding protein-like [Lingula anatina]